MHNSLVTQKVSLQEIDSFMDWLQGELDKRNWSSYELTKRARLSHSVMSKARNDKQPLGYDACIRIAKALELPATLVLQKAGLLPESPLENPDPELDEMAFLFEQLSEEDRTRIISIARTFLTKK